MNLDDLRAVLGGRGVDGWPPQDGRAYAIESPSGFVGVLVRTDLPSIANGWWPDGEPVSVRLSSVRRHAPLPALADVAALQSRLAERDAEAEALRLQLVEVDRERGRLREREAHFAKALAVADGGQYRADWPGAMERCIRDRDAARAENEALRARVAEVERERDEVNERARSLAEQMACSIADDVVANEKRAARRAKLIEERDAARAEAAEAKRLAELEQGAASRILEARDLFDRALHRIHRALGHEDAPAWSAERLDALAAEAAALRERVALMEDRATFDVGGGVAVGVRRYEGGRRGFVIFRHGVWNGGWPRFDDDFANELRLQGANADDIAALRRALTEASDA